VRRVLVTGMSGTGKTSALEALAGRGHRVVETDVDGWSKWVTTPDGEGEWLWDENRMAELLAGEGGRTLFVSGCVRNQETFYGRFDAVVLLSASAEVLVDRIERRTTNDYGKSAEERELVLVHLETVEPLLRATCTHELDASRPLEEIVDELEAIGGRS
jgi:dephospho-CoA kinase